MWPFDRKICAIVDAYSSGNLLARAFRKKGYRAIHVQSTPEVPAVDVSSRRPQDFVATVVHTGDLEATIERVKAYRPRVLIPGAEEGVALADILSERLGLKTNGTRMSAARRDKFAMAEAVRSTGLRSVRSIRSANVGEVQAWIDRDASYPVVAKPPNSSGTDSVTLCRSAEDLKAAFASLLGRETRLDERIHDVLVQSYLKGPEFVVNTVSCEGVHFVTDIWRSVKTRANDHDFVYDHLDLQDPAAESSKTIKAYVLKVLDALRIRYGPAHSEVILTDDGPVLLEVGSRLGGGPGYLLAEECLGTHPVEMTVDAYTEARRFLLRAEDSPRLKKPARIVTLMSENEGIVKAMPGFERVKSLPSYFDVSIGIRPGERILKTIDLFTCYADILLVHEDPDVIHRDYKTIRRMEGEGFFELE